MKRKILFTAVLILVLAGVFASPTWASDPLGPQLAQVRSATAAFHNLDTAKAARYRLVPGLDFCFDNPGVGGMGFHYINTNIMDNTVDPRNPEALVYAPGPNGQLQLAAVEYIVPISTWTSPQPPTLFGQTFERNTDLGVYALHAWIWLDNSLGMFSDWNPKVSCN